MVKRVGLTLPWDVVATHSLGTFLLGERGLIISSLGPVLFLELEVLTNLNLLSFSLLDKAGFVLVMVLVAVHRLPCILAANPARGK